MKIIRKKRTVKTNKLIRRGTTWEKPRPNRWRLEGHRPITVERGLNLLKSR